MPTPLVSFTKRDLVVVALALVLAGAIWGCRRNSKLNPNGNSNSSTVSGPEEERREAESLLAIGKELYNNDQDEQAADAFQKAISLNPDLA